MGKYTAGPWHVEGDPATSRKLCVQAGDRKRSVTPVAWIVPHAHAVANARLIATAPEMFEVLETIENDGKQVPAWLWDLIQAVIIKAGGKSKGNANISPSEGPCTELVAESSDGPSNSSEGKVEQKPTPGEKSIGTSTPRHLRLLKDAGEDFEKRIQDPDP